MVINRLANLFISKRNNLLPLACGVLGCYLVTGGEDLVLFILALALYFSTALILLKNTGGFMITPALMFYLIFTILIYIAGLGFFFSDGAEAIYAGGVRNYTFYLTLQGGVFTLALGTIMATMAFNFVPRVELQRFRNLPWQDDHQEPGQLITFVLLAIMALLATTFYIKQRGFIPLVEIIRAQGQGNVYELAGQARALFSRSGRGAGSYLYGGYFLQFYFVILPFITLFVGAKYLHYRRKSLLLLWLLLGLTTGFFLAMSLQRWPLMFFIILNYLLYANYATKIKTTHAIFFISMTIALFGMLTYIRGTTDYGVLIEALQRRIFHTTSEVLYAIIEIFPDHFAFLGGRGLLADLKGVIPGPDIGFSSRMFNAVYRAYGNGTAPTVFWGQMYADFGLPGVWIGSMGAGFVMQTIYIVYLRSKKILLHLVIYAMMTMALAALAITNLISAVFQFGMVTILLLLVSLNIGSWVFSVREGATIEAQGKL